MSVKSTRIVVRSLPNGLGDYIGAVCDVVKVVREENCGCPVYHARFPEHKPPAKRTRRKLKEPEPPLLAVTK